MPLGTTDQVSGIYGPMAIYRFLRGPAYPRCEPMVIIRSPSMPRATLYAHELYGENTLADFGGDTRYAQHYGTEEPIFHTPVPEHLPQPNMPPESNIKEYNEQVNRVFIDMALDDLFGNEVMDNRLETMDSIDNWVDPVADNAYLESSVVGVEDGISNDSTAVVIPETELSNALSLDDMLGSPSDTYAIEHTDHAPEDWVDASSLEAILGEKMGDPMTDDILDAEPAQEEPEQMPPYMPPEPFVGW